MPAPQNTTSVHASVSVIVPTFREVKNLPELIERVGKVRREHTLDLELIVVDDNSRDGTEEFIAALNQPWVKLIVRRDERGLSSAVIRGLERAQNDILLVMDADLSHPPEKIPELVARIESGADFVIGSRYVTGGTTDAAWGLFRWLNSKIATLMARPFTSARDPMAGFFALRRDRFLASEQLNPIGYKIGLELIVKCGCRRVEEVPIHFADRTRGESKLNLREQLRYMQHLGRLARFRHYKLIHLAALVLCIAAFIIPTAVFLPQQSYFVDEATQLSGLTLNPIEVTKWLAGHEAHRFGVPPDRSPPMSYWSGWMWSKIFGLSEFAMRWFGVLCGGMAVIIVFEAARRAWGLTAALTAGLLIALSPNTIVETVEIRSYPLYLLFSACAMFCLVGLHLQSSRAEWKWLIGMAASCVLAMYTHFFGVVLSGAVFAAALALSFAPRARPVRVIVAGALTLACSIGLWPFVAAAVAKSSADEAGGVSAVELARFAYRSLFGHPVMSLSATAQLLGMMALASLGLIALWPKRRASSASHALILTLVAGMCAAIVAGFVLTRFESLNPSYNLWRLPAIALLCGSALAVRRPALHIAALASALVLVLCSAYGAVQLMRHGEHYSHGPHRQMTSLIELYGADQVAIVHDQHSLWGKSYFPIVFALGESPEQFVVANGSPGSVNVQRLPERDDSLPLNALDSRYIMVVQGQELSHTDVATYIRGGEVALPRGSAVTALLSDSANWRYIDQHQFRMLLGADVTIFERAR